MLVAILRTLLEKSNVDHKQEILKETSLKHAHIYCKINRLSGQVTGGLIEYYIKTKYNMTKNKESDCIGDLQHNNINYEIKVSNGGKYHRLFNYVQIRFNHQCDYLLTAYYLSNENVEEHGELYIFKIPKNDMKYLILKHGQYAHGTIRKFGRITPHQLNDINNNTKEYAIRPKYNDKCWNTLLEFRIDETDI